jgi:hypothetical protein
MIYRRFCDARVFLELHHGIAVKIFTTVSIPSAVGVARFRVVITNTALREPLGVPDAFRWRSRDHN